MTTIDTIHILPDIEEIIDMAWLRKTSRELDHKTAPKVRIIVLTTKQIKRLNDSLENMDGMRYHFKKGVSVIRSTRMVIRAYGSDYMVFNRKKI